MSKLQPEEFLVWCAYVKTLTGIVIDSSKGYLIENRLSPLAEKLGCTTFQELYYKVRSDATRALEQTVVDLISTGETQFFRDQFPFDLLKVKLLPEMIARKRELSPQGKLSIRIWSAACASGQEVYSIAMVLKEVLPDIHKHDVSILGTDISDLALARAAGGVYNAIEVERGLSKKRLEHHFVHSAGAWTVSPELRSLATFKKLNLLEDFSRQGTFDLVFCRNVAIYFSESDRQGLFTRMGKALNANGVLIVGSTELVTLASSQFVSKTHDRAVYYQNK